MARGLETRGLKEMFEGKDDTIELISCSVVRKIIRELYIYASSQNAWKSQPRTLSFFKFLGGAYFGSVK